MASILGDLPSTTDLEQIAGAGGINYIQIGNITKDFESNLTTGWNRYANSVAAATPEVSPGGSPNAAFTLAASNSSPLRGSYSGLITKDANNRQGHGVRTDAFSIHSVDVSQPLFISFDYEMSSNYVAGDMTVYISDGTNIISPALVNIPSGKGTMKIAFNATTSTSYRLIFHVSSTSALSYTMKFDTVSVGPQQQIVTAAIGDWQQYSPVLFGSSNGLQFTNNTCTGFWRRVGDSIEVNATVAFTGAPGTGTGHFRLTLPAGIAIDTMKLASVSNSGMSAGYLDDNGTGRFSAVVNNAPGDIFGGANSVRFTAIDSTTILSQVNATNPFTWANGDSIVASFMMPVVGWSSNINLVSSSTEYAYNTNTTNANDTTSFGSGSEGVLFPNRSVGTSVTKRVRFNTPIQPGDKIAIEVTSSGSESIWREASMIYPAISQGASNYGINWAAISGNATDINIVFNAQGTTPDNATYAGNGSAWSTLFSGGQKWRVRKSAGTAVGELPQTVFVAAQGASVSGIANTISTYATGATLFLPAGNYVFQAKMHLSDDATSSTTRTSGRLALFDAASGGNTVYNPANNSGFAQVNGAAAESKEALLSMTTPMISWPGGSIFLRGLITTVGGSGVSRTLRNGVLVAIKV